MAKYSWKFIPKKFRIGGLKWKVRFKDKSMNLKSRYGEVNPSRQRISLANSIKGEKLEEKQSNKLRA